LAALAPIEYDRVREETAKNLRIRVSTLDDEVKKRQTRTESGGKTEGETILLSDPEPWPESVDIASVLTILTRTVKRFVIVTDSAITAIALWIVNTYAHDAANVSAILSINSPEKRCGKTTLVELLTALVVRALPTANVTPATIFRSVATFRPTLLIDEA